ncbi:SGNH/GDSL hydrolase family protein [Xenorhabdus koppenhoeferi]|uniref:GDSL-like Lipase/Acylhydrolase n=1 Tax=Xenorhabdus koppenhoeferi TaxID=351659 RepID=A0A1I7J0T2_9GAMM|nr:SGNH/GDSL hydrolase family protein [Xenorhabdus koppenhoeferi]CEE91895.1 putative exported protein [Xenorhabdus nematophila str. Anatoliense]SFU78788.1 GDSL-like Lipase/Acylhydrolase [Xenorhabdus koppenhoeferi]
MKIRNLIKFIFLLLFFSSSGFCKALLLGDSLTYIYGEAYKSIISKDADVVYKVGSGLLNRSKYDWFSAVESVNFDKYDLVIVSIGTNDFNREITSVNYSRSIFELIGRIRNKNKNARIIWISPPFLKNKEHDILLSNTRYIVRSTLNQLGVIYFDITKDAVLGERYSDILDGKKIRTSDGIHITKYGANLVVEHLKLFI